MSNIAFRVCGGTFTVRTGPTLTTIVLFALLIALGCWQVQRLHWKENLLAEIHTRMANAPRDVSAITQATDLEYVPARASGVFLHDKEIYLHAISLTGEGGYHVLTPLRLKNGSFVLVDRGFVPFDKEQSATRMQGQTAGQVTVTGVLRQPVQRWLVPANSPDQKEWFGIDLPAMAKATGVDPLMPYVLEADATPNAGGYPAGGQTRLNLPNNHMSYIITWFGLAAVLLVIYGVHGWRRDK